ncbi:dUTP diphosphatase [Lysinibacillus sp. 1P01SD]|uniref:dUTP diphosphatase n=1 Tax=Lysinibacillus sp. 1P01SD TaxID=3132285 RepID=UPI0039A09927
MNLTKLFETQAALDEHIMQEHPELLGQNNLDWKLLALQVELGECANEWRGFKKWSKDQEPRTKVVRNPIIAGEPLHYNPLLEEYVDCLHFILSIGLELEVDWKEMNWLMIVENDTTKRFQRVFSKASELTEYQSFSDERWGELFEEFYHLGTLLGFTWDEIETAYYAKNKVNHERQNAGY